MKYILGITLLLSLLKSPSLLYAQEDGEKNKLSSFLQVLDGADALPDASSYFFKQQQQVIKIFLFKIHPQTNNNDDNPKNDEADHPSCPFFFFTAFGGIKKCIDQLWIEMRLNDQCDPKNDKQRDRINDTF